MSNLKGCPLAAANPQQSNSDCLGEACACYVKMHKHHLWRADNCKFDDPQHFYQYEGCGLVAQIPWKLCKRENNPKTST